MLVSPRTSFLVEKCAWKDSPLTELFMKRIQGLVQVFPPGMIFSIAEKGELLSGRLLYLGKTDSEKPHRPLPHLGLPEERAGYGVDFPPVVRRFWNRFRPGYLGEVPVFHLQGDRPSSEPIFPGPAGNPVCQGKKLSFSRSCFPYIPLNPDFASMLVK